MKHDEFIEQTSFIKWCRLAARSIPDLISFVKNDSVIELALYSNNNTQLFNSKAASSRHKAMGSVPGVPDIFLPKARNGYHGLYIEFKSPSLKPKTSQSKGGLSYSQIARIKQLQEDGYKVAICYSWIEAKNVLLEYLGK